MQSLKNLQCNELVICDNVDVKKAFQDQVLLNDERVLENLLTSEDKYLPSSSYFKCVQTDIEPWMRNKVAAWMLEVCQEQRCEEEVFPLSMNLMDRFLSIVDIKRQNLQLLGATAIFIASKMKETVPLTSEKLIAYTAYSVGMHELIEWELLVLGRLKWDVSAVTPHDLVEQLLCRLPHLIPRLQQHAVKRRALSYIAHCYAADFKFAAYPASMLAAGGVGAAATSLCGPHPALLPALQAITCIDVDCLQACQEQIEKTVAKPSEELSHLHAQHRHARSSDHPTTPTDVRDIDL